MSRRLAALAVLAMAWWDLRTAWELIAPDIRALGDVLRPRVANEEEILARLERDRL